MSTKRGRRALGKLVLYRSGGRIYKAFRVIQRLGGGCRKFVPVLGGGGTKISPPGVIFDQPPGEMSWIRGNIANHVEDHVVLSAEGSVLVASPGAESSYPPPPNR